MMRCVPVMRELSNVLNKPDLAAKLQLCPVFCCTAASRCSFFEKKEPKKLNSAFISIWGMGFDSADVPKPASLVLRLWN
jgi:hypothetical protein